MSNFESGSFIYCMRAKKIETIKLSNKLNLFNKEQEETETYYLYLIQYYDYYIRTKTAEVIGQKSSKKCRK